MSDSSPNSLIEQGQPLVHSLAAKIHRSTGGKGELDDLIAYGEVGLAEAARDFDPQQGCQFTTFAYYRVRGAIYDGLSKMSWTSRSQYKRLRNEQMANETLLAEAGRGTATQTLADRAGWLGNVTERLAMVYFVTRGEQQGGGVRESTVEDTGMVSAANIVALQEASQKLRELVDTLPEIERRLIRSVYFEDTTLQEAGQQLGISKSWASRLHARILDKLAATLRRQGVSN